MLLEKEQKLVSLVDDSTVIAVLYIQNPCHSFLICMIKLINIQFLWDSIEERKVSTWYTFAIPKKFNICPVRR